MTLKEIYSGLVKSSLHWAAYHCINKKKCIFWSYDFYFFGMKLRYLLKLSLVPGGVTSTVFKRLDS